MLNPPRLMKQTLRTPLQMPMQTVKLSAGLACTIAVVDGAPGMADCWMARMEPVDGLPSSSVASSGSTNLPRMFFEQMT